MKVEFYREFVKARNAVKHFESMIDAREVLDQIFFASSHGSYGWVWYTKRYGRWMDGLGFYLAAPGRNLWLEQNAPVPVRKIKSVLVWTAPKD